jgi:hypothetical protein
MVRQAASVEYLVMNQKSMLRTILLGGMGLTAMIAGFVSTQSTILYAAPCETLVCNKPSDCGSSCFCNDPQGDKGDGACFLDS